MHSASNFHPEWGCLSPSPNLIRSVCIALVATAVGATSGAIVMNLLLERPGSSDAIPSLAARALTRNAPVIVAPVGTASFINASAAAALIARSAQAKPAAADTPQPAPDATPALTACVLPSAHTPSGTASPAAGRGSGDAAGSGEKRSTVKTSSTSTARVAKAEAKKKGLPPKRRWQTATNDKYHRYYDQSFRPSFQRPNDRPFAQFGYSEPPHDW
jgi:hypothetical protein